VKWQRWWVDSGATNATPSGVVNDPASIRAAVERRRRAHRWRSFGLAAAAVLGCGRSADRTTLLASAAPGAYVREQDAAPPMMDAGLAGEPPPADDPRQAQLMALLQRECRSCHDGSPDDPGTPLDEVYQLFEYELLKAGIAQASKLMLWLQYGDTRPAHAGIGASREEFDALSAFINDYRYPAPLCAPVFTGRDRLVAELAADILSRPEADRAFIRYVTTSYEFDSGICTQGLQSMVSAIQQLPNATSLGAVAITPQQILSGGPAYALDIRDYAWNRPLDVDGDGQADFTDAWLAIVDAAAPYALELSGPDADVLKAATGTAVPALPGNAFVAAAGEGPLYYALIGVDGDLWQLARRLGVDLDGGAASAPARAGIFGNDDAPARVVTRYEQTAHPGHAYWVREELAPNVEQSWLGVLESAPFGYAAQSHEAIFHLPNGAFAYAFGTGDGSPLHSVPCMNASACATDLRVSGTMTCRGCHARWGFAVEDQVASFASAAPDRFDAPTLARTGAEYGTIDWAVFDVDMNTAYEATPGDPDAITYVYFTFLNRRLDAAFAAGELGMTQSEFASAIERLQAGGASAAALEALHSGGSIDRAAFGSIFVALACAFDGTANRPASCR
jgi:hypothetical protein